MKTVTIENITEIAIEAMSSEMEPRIKEILTSLITHLHDFARDVNLTHEEWLKGMEIMAHAGRMTDGKRNEFILLSDIIGLESLVDAISHNQQGEETESAVLGPFFREGAPVYPAGASISQRGEADGPGVLLTGYVKDLQGNAVTNAVIDVWETGPEGLYEQQDPNQPEFNLRGRFKTDENGYYKIKAVKPVSYPIPYDGPSGDLLQAMGRHPYRPAHIHMILQAQGYQTLVSQLYDKNDEYIDSDSVFAVKGSLLIDFKPAPAEMETVEYVVEHDVILKKA